MIIDTSSLINKIVLKDPWPNDQLTFRRGEETPQYDSTDTPSDSAAKREAAIKNTYINTNFSGGTYYVSINLRRIGGSLMQDDTPVLKIEVPFVYRYPNNSTVAYAENIKLPEDDKPYSYIRIYDPDKREVLKNLKLTEIGIKWFLLKNDDSFLLFSETGSNFTKFFNFEKQEISDFLVTTVMGPMYIDDSLYVTSSMRGYKIDWNAVSVEDEPNPNVPVIYPNPTNNTVNIDIEQTLYHGQWQLTDLSGNVMLQGIILPNPQLHINVEVLPAKTYFLRLQKDNITVTYQVVKI